MPVSIGKLTTTPAPGDPIVTPWYQQIATYARHIFTNKAQADSQWANAPDGAAAFTTTEGVRWDRIGGAWVNRDPMFFYGIWNGNLDGNGYARLTWPVAFPGIAATGDNPAVPQCGVSCIGGRQAANPVINLGRPGSFALGGFNAKDCIVRVFDPTTGVSTGGTYALFHWMVWGPRYAGQPFNVCP